MHLLEHGCRNGLKIQAAIAGLTRNRYSTHKKQVWDKERPELYKGI